MLVENTSSQGSGVVGAIRNAARATGTSFEYLLATAQVESGFNPNASATSSTARGLFQFIEQTWLTTLKEAGPSLGYGNYANAIVKTPSGRYEVPDPAMRREILGLRHDPAANAAMAGAFTSANAARLTDRLGRAPSEGELYMAHFLGAAGAGRLISLAAETPGAVAAAQFPGAANANRSIFYDKQGRARTAAEVCAVLDRRYNIARSAPNVPESVAAAAPVPPLPVPTSVRTVPVNAAVSVSPVSAVSPASAAAAAVPATAPASRTQGRRVFHSLFSDNGNREPVSRVVQDLWATRPHVAAALSGQSPVPARQGAAPARQPVSQLDLFTDQPARVQDMFGKRT